MSAMATDMITNIKNNIQTNFISYIKRYVNSSFRKVNNKLLAMKFLSPSDYVKWPFFAQWICFAYNSVPHETLGHVAPLFWNGLWHTPHFRLRPPYLSPQLGPYPRGGGLSTTLRHPPPNIIFLPEWAAAVIRVSVAAFHCLNAPSYQILHHIRNQLHVYWHPPNRPLNRPTAQPLTHIQPLANLPVNKLVDTHTWHARRQSWFYFFKLPTSLFFAFSLVQNISHFSMAPKTSQSLLFRSVFTNGLGGILQP